MNSGRLTWRIPFRFWMKKFLKFVHDDNCYCKYYEVVYILFHTGMRISEFCGLTISDIDFEHHLINIDHQLQRSADMTLVIQETKTHAGTRKLPMTADVEQCFRAIIEDRPTPRFECMVDGRSGFLFLDKDCLRKWRCTGSTVSTIWSSATTISIGFKCPTSHRTSAAIPTAAIRPKPG